MKGTEKTRNSKKRFLQYYIHAAGNISLACANANLSRQHTYTWLKDDEAFRKAKERIDRDILRFAASKLLVKAKQNDIKALAVLMKRAEKRTKNHSNC